MEAMMNASRRIGFMILGASFAVAPALSGQGKGGGKCQNVPIRVTLLPLGGGMTSVLRGDVSDTYQDGVGGVSAQIHLCSGTRDATIATSGSTRRIFISFPQPVEGSVNDQPPVFAGQEILVPFFFNIRNILCYSGPCENEDTFTTRMNWQFTGPDGKPYRLRFYPADADSPDLHSPNTLINEPDINEPNGTSPVLVHHRPGNCANSGGNPVVFDQWDVTALNPNTDPNSGLGVVQLGTLHRDASRRDPRLHMGQYSMPYQLQISALRCF
jgi:hypothetical protein